MIVNTATVGFIMSHACPLKCDFCCHDRETIGGGRIGRTMLIETMLGFANQPGVLRFAFSGGDPFLYYDDIVAAMRTVREQGVAQPFHIVTSGYWAKAEETRARLEALQALGMDKLHLSYDTEHSRWVTPDQIMQICRICADLGIGVELYASFWDEAEDIRDLLPDIHDFAEVHHCVVVRAGRARRSGRRARHNMPEQAKYSCGEPGHYSIAIYPTGKAYPCCGGDFNEAGKLSCGNVRTDSPAEILHAAFGNFHVRTVKEFGWGALYQFVARDFPELVPELPKFEDVDSPCEICRDLNVKLKPKLAPVYARMEAEYARTMAEHEFDGRSQGDAGKAGFCFAGKPVTRDAWLSLLDGDPDARRRYVSGQDRLEAAAASS